VWRIRSAGLLLVVVALVAEPAGAANTGPDIPREPSSATARSDHTWCQKDDGPREYPKKLTSLTVRTSGGSRSAEVVLSRPLTVQEDDGGIDWCGSPPVFTWRGCGRYRGFLFQPVGVDPKRADVTAFGLLDVASFRPAESPKRRMPIPLAARAIPDPLRLPAGHYRLHLLCDGAGEIRIPTLKSDLPRSRVVTATRPTQFNFREAPILLDSAAAVRAPVGTTALPLPVDGGPSYVGALTHVYESSYPMPVTGGYPPLAALTDACIDGVGSLDLANACDAVSRYGRRNWGRQGRFSPQDGGASQEFYLVFQPGGMPEGDHVSYHTAAAAGTSSTHSVAANFILRP